MKGYVVAAGYMGYVNSDGCMSDTPETMGGLSGVPNGTSSQTI